MTETNRIQEHQVTTETTNRITLNGDEPREQPQNNGSTSKFRIAPETINQTCSGLPDEQRKALQWAEQFCRARNLSADEFGAMLLQTGRKGSVAYSGDSVYAAFTGRREVGSLDRFCQAVHTLRKRVEETKTRSSIPFVETGMTRKVFEACDAAREKKRIVFVFGETQTGKSRSLNEYALRNPDVRLFMMPTKATLTEVYRELAISLGIPSNSTKSQLRRAIFDRIDENTLLIVDECERCVEYARGTEALDFLRELFERRKCGIVLAGAMNLRNALRSSYTLKKLWLRGYRPAQLPDRPGRKALDCFARAFGLEPAPDKTIAVHVASEGERIVGNPLAIQEEVITKSGLGRWLMILEDAMDSARDAGAHISWGRVIAAHHNIASFEAVTTND